MREIISLNGKWAFTKQAEVALTGIDEKWETVDVPH